MGVGPACSGHLSTIMPDSIFYENIRLGITYSVLFCIIITIICLFVVFFLRGETSVFLRMKEMKSALLL